MKRVFASGAMQRSLATLRARLVLASLLSMIVVLGLGLLTLRAAYGARDAVAAAERSYERVALYTRLDYAATEFETRALSSMTQPRQSAQAAPAARRDFQALLARAAASRFQTAGQEAARARIVAQGQVVLASLVDVDGEMRRLEAIERASGPRGVGLEIGRIRAPHDLFHLYVTAQITSGDREVAARTVRAIALNQVLATAAVVGFGAVLVLSLTISLTLLRRLKQGLNSLEAGARAVGAGELSHRIALSGRDELAAFSGAFDCMAEKLQLQQAELKAVNSNLEAAVAARTGDLSRANEALAEEDRRRRGFLAYVGHELRTPLTIIRGEAQLALREADPGAVDYAPILGRILDQTHDLERLVDDLFLIARAESGGLKLNRRPTDLSELARRVATDFEALAAEGEAIIRADLSPPVEADVDPDRVRQMMAALIDNALRHTRPGVTVKVGAETCRGNPRITVRDDGPGVSPDQTEELFTRFRRGDGVRGTGSGLGLAVVRALAEAHGGAAGLENQMGGGVCAWLSFPAVAPAAAVS